MGAAAGASVAIVGGTDGNDVLYGTQGDDLIFAGAGDDLVYGGDGNDIIQAGLGHDVVNGGLGNDTMTSDSGLGILDDSDASGYVTVDLSIQGYGYSLQLVSQDTHSAGQDAFYGFGAVNGSAFDDTLRATNWGPSTLIGNGGSDTLVAGAANDTLTGGTSGHVRVHSRR